MINAELMSDQNGRLCGFHISGHAMMAESGKDVICAFVSSAAYMAANTITDVIGAKAEARASDGDMYVMISQKDTEKCADILAGFKLHLLNTQEQYPEYLKVNFTEVQKNAEN